VRHDADGAETYYRRAIEANPVNADSLCSYAVFLQTVRHDTDAAETYYERAIEADPAHANSLGSYAGILLSKGVTKEGRRLLELARTATPAPEVALELAFYGYAHDPAVSQRQANLTTLEDLLRTGVRSPGWPLDGNVDRAVKDGHPEPEFLRRLACVIADECDISGLDQFDCWSKD
jgi:tetratricopeptide (TPR) repeat protein